MTAAWARTPKLSICISTFNRDAFIGQTLDSIVGQATDETEIVVVDGASTDGTPRLLREYERRCRRLEYFRQDLNSGVDADFNRAVEVARGEYCWLMTDDDLLRPGAIARVLSELDRDVALVVVNAEVMNADFSRMLTERQLAVTADRVYRPAEFQELFADVARYLSFISGVVIRRDVWLSRERKAYFGTEFIHVGVIFQRSLPSDARVIADPLITIRYGNAQWTGRRFRVWAFGWPALIWSFGDVEEWAKQRVCAREPWRNTRTLLVHRAIGSYTIEEYRRFLAPKIAGRLARWRAWAVARCPGVLLNTVALILCWILGGRYVVGVVDLKNSRFYIGRLLARRGTAAAKGR